LTHTIIYKETPTNEEVLAIAAPLQKFNTETGPPINYHPVVLQLVDADGAVVGGLFGRIAYDWLHIEWLVVPETVRGTGVGRSLMQRAEAIAVEHRCIGAWLNTLTFQARPFYEKLGYSVFGELDKHPWDVALFFLQKRF
jgi:GNAT superfamily N-acetyltransferase